MSDQLCTVDFADVQAALWRARSQWYNIGVRLKMDTTDLDVIDKEAGYEIKDKFNRMILSWLKTTGPCTWKVLYKALRHPTVNMPDVAQEIETNWIKKELQTFFDTTPTKDAVLPETVHTPSSDLIPVQEPPLPSHTQSDTATHSLPADIPASPAKLSPSDTTPSEDAILPETSHAPSMDLILVQQSPLPSHTRSDTDTTPTKDAVVPETSHAPSSDLIPVQEPPPHTRSNTATSSFPADIPASSAELLPCGAISMTTQSPKLFSE